MAGVWSDAYAFFAPSSPSFGLGVRSDVLLTGGSELRGKRREEEEEGREVGGPL